MVARYTVFVSTILYIPAFRINIMWSTPWQSTKLPGKWISGESVRVVLDFNQKTVSFYKGDTELFVVNDLPTEKGIKYKLFVDSDKATDKFTILNSSGNVPTVSMDAVIEALNLVNDSVQKANAQMAEYKSSMKRWRKSSTPMWKNIRLRIHCP